ncbi:MAG: aldehyde:ferredoxin oxidoreductase [Desulfobacteraceae bacterium]|nr:MAG: aldehyde:ferredoxin oxidoreductase [Desulfobacteraceae bacterium]
MDGFYNQVLVVDLSGRQSHIEPVEDRILSSFLGGKGLSSWLLYERNPKGADPLEPENHLVFATGPATGSAAWGSSRYGVFTKSPLTGLYAESYSGGRVPEAVGATGFDAVVLHGKSPALSVLEITPEGARFHDAEDLKGKDTFDTERLVKARYGSKPSGSWKSGIVVTGPAAENGVRFSIIKNDGWRCAGRAGTGTVLAAKNLKAVVFKGDKKRKIHDPDGLKALSKMLAAESKESPVVHAYKSMGTSQMVKILNGAGAFPTRYWSMGQAPHWEKISADALHTQCRVTPHACAKCFLSCGRMTTILDGPHKGLTLEGPEYETLYAFGGLCMIDSVDEIARLNHLCDSLGMDTITAGNLCAFAMKAFEMKTSDYEIRFGQADETADLLELISNQKDIGRILAKGITHAEETFGMTGMGVHVKGMEPAGYDPRVLKGMGLAYASSDRGACHLRATFYKPELAGMIPPSQIQDKARLFIDFEDRLTLFDSMILCKFFRDIYPWELLGDLIRLTTGVEGDQDTLSAIARNTAKKARDFNLREGMTPDHEILPDALFEPLQDSGARISRDEMNTLMQDYHSRRAW